MGELHILALNPTKQEMISLNLHARHAFSLLTYARKFGENAVKCLNQRPLSQLCKNIGKDLSKISMPVTLNEPLSALQRLCEELEYSELLDKAAAADSQVDR